MEIHVLVTLALIFVLLLALAAACARRRPIGHVAYRFGPESEHHLRRRRR